MKKKEVKYPIYKCEKCGKETTVILNSNYRCSCGGKMHFGVIKVTEEMANKAHKIVGESKGFYFY